MGTAIYLVVLESRTITGSWVQVWDVINAVPCFLETVDALYAEHLSPLQRAGRNVQAMYIAREPYPNPFQEKAAEALEPEQGGK